MQIVCGVGWGMKKLYCISELRTIMEHVFDNTRLAITWMFCGTRNIVAVRFCLLVCSTDVC